MTHIGGMTDKRWKVTFANPADPTGETADPLFAVAYAHDEREAEALARSALSNYCAVRASELVWLATAPADDDDMLGLYRFFGDEGMGVGVWY